MKFNQKLFREILQTLAYYVIPGILFLNILYKVFTQQNLYSDVVEFGEIAFNLLILILMIKPLSVLFSKIWFFRYLVTCRRELGVLAFWFAMIHSIALIIYKNLDL